MEKYNIMPQQPNKIVVDLEGLNLQEDELAKLQDAVKGAVLKELGSFGGTRGANLGVIPGLRDPSWVGLIIRDLAAFDVNAAKINEVRERAGF
jgi:hypothetical protein